ncbi:MULTISPECIES: RNA polymerase factor sigma-54 [unclassified Psychrobacter]|uniref:RNA polymerase factor sigma-54 n=1 Tax=unclassified Psychrobacter TaxID=196806 RepID=UPI0018F793BB|nr:MULTISPECIES: RNA polymerase factor sigma-54 [unclassified Psychrobacter]
MSMSFGLTATLSTSQKLTPQMQQAIKLLQLSSLELAQEVQAKLDSNPLLERVEDDAESAEIHEQAAKADSLELWNTSSSDSGTVAASEDNDTPMSDSWDKLQQPTMDDDASDVPLEESDRFDAMDGFSTIDVGSLSRGGLPMDEDLDSYQGATSACIQDHVRWQLNFKRLSDTDILIADYLMDAMDDRGFIDLDIDELLRSFETMASFYQWEMRIDYDEIMAVLHIIQSCDPLGVGARSLAECLSLQLARLNADTPHLEHAKALLRAPEHLTSNNIKALTETTGLQPEHISLALQVLRTLNPNPGQAFYHAQPDYMQAPDSYDIPDVLVIPIREHSKKSAAKEDKDDEAMGWQVRLNPDTLPKLQVNQEYANLIKRGDDSPTNQYLKTHLTDARLFIRSIEERNQNLLRVATSIIRRQQAFLEHGATAMQPLILKDIAEELSLHESTVSRLTTSKSILTPQGLFSLKHFFSSHVSSNEGDISSTAISAMIKQMIQQENPKKPLSDSRIQAALLADGIDIARRTVAKYREAMNIGSSTQRKQKF